MPGRRARTLCLSIAALTLLGLVATANAATERITASKSRAVTGAPTDLGASAAKKKGKGGAATTKSSQVAFASSTTVSAVASCTGKTHVTGGGFGVSPSFNPSPAPGAGLRSVNSTSNPSGPKAWSAGGSAFSTPLSSGSFTTYARCESNRLGKLAGIISSSLTLVPAQAQTFSFNCPPGTHVLSGGYAGSGIAGFTPVAANFRIIPLQSHRNGPGQWIVQASNSSAATTSATLTGYAVCERNAKGNAVSEVSTITSLVNDARATADPTCSGKTHVVSGGFLLAPNSVGTVPVALIDEFKPVGSKSWHLGLHESNLHNLPAGSSVQTFAYCKKG